MRLPSQRPVRIGLGGVLDGREEVRVFVLHSEPGEVIGVAADKVHRVGPSNERRRGIHGRDVPEHPRDRHRNGGLPVLAHVVQAFD